MAVIRHANGITDYVPEVVALTCKVAKDRYEVRWSNWSPKRWVPHEPKRFPTWEAAVAWVDANNMRERNEVTDTSRAISGLGIYEIEEADERSSRD